MGFNSAFKRLKAAIPLIGVQCTKANVRATRNGIWFVMETLSYFHQNCTFMYLCLNLCV
jgi:hypothetical protein